MTRAFTRLWLPATAALALAGLLVAFAVVSSGDAAEPASPPPLRTTLIASPVVENRILADPRLAALPWLRQGPGAPSTPYSRQPQAPGLTFPAGTTYPAALNSLYLSLATTGTLPTEARIAPPLPAGKVLMLPRDPTQGVTLSLSAPFGYDPLLDLAVSPSFSLPGALPVDQAQATFAAALARRDPIPPGGALDVPILPSCAVILPSDDPQRPGVC